MSDNTSSVQAPTGAPAVPAPIETEESEDQGSPLGHKLMVGAYGTLGFLVVDKSTNSPPLSQVLISTAENGVPVTASQVADAVPFARGLTCGLLLTLAASGFEEYLTLSSAVDRGEMTKQAAVNEGTLNVSIDLVSVGLGISAGATFGRSWGAALFAPMGGADPTSHALAMVGGAFVGQHLTSIVMASTTHYILNELKKGARQEEQEQQMPSGV